MSIRPNARTLRSSPNRILSSLVPLYHQTAHFLPLTQSSLPSTLDPILAPIGGNSSHQPTPAQLGRLLDRAALLAAAGHQAKAASLTALPSFSGTSFNTHAITDAPLADSWLAAQRTGREHALVERVRRAVDGLCGTVGGGRAGEATMAELGEGAVEDARVREEERKVEEEEAKRQEALDARLESEYKEDGENVRA